jgi:hypothetical protein
VKTTKTEYDKLKSDVIQKIDLLTASRWWVRKRKFRKISLLLFVLVICIHMS